MFKKSVLHYYPHLLFILLFFTFSWVYDYQEIVNKRPQSIHKWRQSDGASLALNYYQGGMHFLKPEVHNLTSDHGTSGKCFPSEVPILYYSVACLYKIFGYHEWIYRGFNTLIFFFGLYFLFRLLLYVLKDVFWSLTIPLLLFSSPVLVYYANNYLSNSSAFAVSLIGWYFFTRFIFENKRKQFNSAVLFFFIAAMFKITALFSLLSIIACFIIEFVAAKKFADNKKLFGRSFKLIAPAILCVVLLVVWTLFVRYYNLSHDSTYFSTTIFPIWSLTHEDIGAVLNNIEHTWLPQYFHISVLVLLGSGFLLIAVNFKKSNSFFRFVTLLVFIEIILYVLLQFWTFADHDYYTIDLYILPVLILITLFEMGIRNYGKIVRSPILKIAFGLFLFFNMLYAKSKNQERYETMSDYVATQDFYTISPYLRYIGITPDDTVISIPDLSHVSLYLMNQKGWTEYIDTHFNKGTPFQYNSDSAGIQSSIDKGAKYLILNGIEEYYKKPYLQKFATYLIGKYNNILIFKLRDKKDNFSPGQRMVKQKYTCNAETVSSDKTFFTGTPEQTAFQFAVSQTDSFAHSGKHACRLNEAVPYGMTFTVNGIAYGESFVISVWRKAGPHAKGTVIVSADSTFYDNEFRVIEKTADGWEKVAKEFFISHALEGKELVIYLYNAEKVPAWFDDLEVTWYASYEKDLKFEQPIK